MEDWEQFFIEKSQRRATKERAERRRRKRYRTILMGTIVLILVGSVAALVAHGLR